MASQDGGGFRLNVLNPGGRDSEQHFGTVCDDANEHAPVNFHAYAACTGGSFFRDTARAIKAGDPILLLLRGDFRASERALVASKRAQVRVAVTLKETGLHQIAQQLRDQAKLKRFLRVVSQADGCLGPTPQAAEIYRTVCRRPESVAFIPTPYPMHDPHWNFSCALEERSGIFVGTREWDVPSRNHLAALLAARRISKLTGEIVTVHDFAGKAGARLLSELEFEKGKLQVLTKRSSYRNYLQVLARHRIVFQLDSSSVPGQVAGDALLCRLPCVGGNGAVDCLAYPELCGTGRSLNELIEVAVGLLKDMRRYEDAVAASQERAAEWLSFSCASAQLERFFSAIASK